MLPSARFESTSGPPRRLRGRTERRGARTGLPTWGAFLFGAVFVAAGGAILLVGVGVLPVDLDEVHAPLWILAVFGAVLVLAGLGVHGLALRQRNAEQQRRAALASAPGNAALADHAWDPRGYAARHWSRAALGLGGTLFLTLFLSIFNWWAFFTPSPWPVKAVTGIFDLVLAAAWWQAIVLLGRALRFGDSRIAFAEFPYRLPGPLDLRWYPATGIGTVTRGSFTLRCVKEWYEARGSGHNRSSHLVHEEQWRGTWFIDRPAEFPPGLPLELRYEAPPGLPPTELAADRPVFWEFEVQLDLPGFDFEETYLVPVYAATGSAGGS